ncbi:MAG: hypothetical protein J6D27_11285 [Ruminiclostridium sp.]|nr:hypothetical protein [Ruminiclostridium sp.]
MNKLTVSTLIKIVCRDDKKLFEKASIRFKDILNKNVLRISENINLCQNGVYFKFKTEPEKITVVPMLAVSDKDISGVPTLVVPDSRAAWVDVCSYILKSDKTRSVAVTGSIGKTTVKDIVYSVLNVAGNAIRNQGSLNGERGLCAAVSGAGKRIDYFSCEMGLNSPSNHFEIMSKAIEPEVCIITNIGSCHIENFTDKAHILECKLKCAEHMSEEDGLLLLNADDELLMNADYRHKVKTFAVESRKADYYCKDVKSSNSSIDFIAVCPDRELQIHLNVPGKHNIYGALAAIAVADKFGIGDEQIIKGLAAFRTSGIRQNVYTVHDNITVINDCYGASPEANTVAFNLLDSMEYDRTKQRKIALLGHISRMGRLSEQVHRELGKKLAGYGFDIVVTYGGKSHIFTDEVKAAGGTAYHFYDTAEFVAFVKSILRPNDIVLCKGVHKSYDFDRYVDQIFNKDYVPETSVYFGTHSNVNSLHVNSPAMALINSSSRELICGKNIHEKRNVASLISLVSAIAALENMSEDEVVTVSANVSRYTTGCRKYGLKTGEKYLLKDLIFTALKYGAADAIYAIALYYSNDLNKFMHIVNKVLYKAGTANTSCVGPYGKMNASCYSTAYDMALIAAYAMQNEKFVKIMLQDAITLTELTQHVQKLVVRPTKLNAQQENDDHLLYSPDIITLKEGANALSKQCIAAVKQNDSEGYNIAVVLGTEENEFTMLSYNEIKCLLDYKPSEI